MVAQITGHGVSPSNPRFLANLARCVIFCAYFEFPDPFGFIFIFCFRVNLRAICVPPAISYTTVLVLYKIPFDLSSTSLYLDTCMNSLYTIFMSIQTPPKGTVKLRFNKILTEFGWTQRELARRAGISINGVANLRTASLIRYETLAALVEATGWSIDQLLEYQNGK